MNILYEDAKKLNDGTKKFSEFNKGDLYVLDGYNPNTGEVIINEVIWENDLEDFDIALEKYGVDRFYIAYSGTCLMTILNYLLRNGFQIYGAKPQEINNGYSLPCIMIDRKISRKNVQYLKKALKSLN